MASRYTVRLIADTKQHDQALDKSAKEVYKYQMRIEGAKKNITGLIKKFAPFASAAGAVTLAIKEFGVAVKTNQQWADSYGRTMQIAKTANEQFISSLTEADFSNFISGLVTATNNAKKLYDALDALNTQKILSKGKLAEYNARLTEAKVRVRKGDKSAVEDIKRYEKLIEDELNKQLPMMENALRAKVVETLNYNEARDGKLDIDLVLNWTQMGEGAIEAEIKRLKRYQDDLDMQAKKQNNITSNITKEMRFGDWGAKWNKARKDIELLSKIKSRLTDGDDLNEIQELIASYWNLKQQMASTKLGDTRYTTEKKSNTETKKTEEVKDELIDRLQEIKKEYEKLLTEKSNIVVELKTDNPSLDRATELAKQLEDLEKQIKEREGLIKEIEEALNRNTEVKDELVEGSLTYLEDALKKLEEVRDKYISQNDVTNTQNTVKEIELLQEKIRLKKIELGLLKEEKQVIEEIKVSDKEVADSLISFASNVNSLGDAIADAFGMDDNSFTKFLDYMQKAINLVSSLTSMMEGLNKVTETLTTLRKANTAATAENTAAKAANTVAAGAETSAESGAAIAGATASGAKLPFPYNLVAIAAGIAAVISALSMIGSFANGGIVGGSTTLGDHNLARVNAGEMILNKREQTRLWRVINGEQQNNSLYGGEVQFKIKGSDLVGTLENYNNRNRRVQ